MIPGRTFGADEIVLPPAATLYLFSDGVFEIETADNRQLTLQDFTPLIAGGNGSSRSEPQRIYRDVRALAKQGPLPDDFSIVVFEFPRAGTAQLKCLCRHRGTRRQSLQ
jgi:sigma-B regulation protein RsbU (phosphoserine phosphatase)